MKSSTVAWFMSVRIGRASIASPASRRSTRNVESPPVRDSPAAGVDVRASSSMRSECAKRLVQIFCPLTSQPPSGLRLGARAQRERVAARVGLGDAEGLQAQLARGDGRQVAPLLLLGAVSQDRAHDVHLRVAGAGVAALVVDLLQDQRRIAQPEAHAAVLLGDQRRQPAALGERRDELLGVGALAVERAPVLAGEAPAELGDALPDGLLIGCQT